MGGEIDTQLFAAMTRAAAGQKADYITMKWKPLKPGIGELMTRVIIAGSRKFNDYNKMLFTVDRIGLHLINTIDPVEIVSGHARGADELGERFAEAYGYPLKIFPADWDKYGKAAGPIRNEQMAKYASEADRGILIAFPIGESRGTRNMIEIAKRYGLEVEVIE
jgi:hypothetical protein